MLATLKLDGCLKSYLPLNSAERRKHEEFAVSLLLSLSLSLSIYGDSHFNFLPQITNFKNSFSLFIYSRSHLFTGIMIFKKRKNPCITVYNCINLALAILTSALSSVWKSNVSWCKIR